jgi:histidinol-phosphate aminotransferase
MAFSNEKIIEKLNIVKSPYNVNSLTQKAVLKQLKNSEIIFDIKNKIIFEREKLEQNLVKLNCVEKVYKSESNFLLIKFQD